jgi:hypothetical protein
MPTNSRCRLPTELCHDVARMFTDRLCSADPAVRAGRLSVQVMTWMVPAGNIRFEDVPAPRSMAEAAAD